MAGPYPEDQALLRAKQDGAYLCRVLRIPAGRAADQHAVCPVCGDKTLRYGVEKEKGTGVFLWQCMKGCGQGTVIDALMLVEGLDTKSAIQEAKQVHGGDQNGTAQRPPLNGHYPSNHQPYPQGRQRALPIVEPDPSQAVRYGVMRPDPVLDFERAGAFVSAANAYLLEYGNIPSHYKRGISADVIRKYNIGFIENVPLKYSERGQGWMIPHAWVLPITDGENKLKAVKLHFERPHPVQKARDSDQWVECEGKNRWAPFGTEPKSDPAKGIKPNHAYYGLWPHPHTFDLPGSRAEFSTDIKWWLDRMPQEGPLAQKWEQTVADEALQIALETKRDYSELDAQEMMQAWQRAFDIIKNEIMRTVCKLLTDQKRDAGEQNTGAMDWNETIFVCPGELKALAVLSAGFMATAVTGGEGWIPPPQVLASLAGARVCVLYDNDAAKKRVLPGGRIDIKQPGHTWADQMVKALRDVGAANVTAKSGGRKEKP